VVHWLDWDQPTREVALRRNIDLSIGLIALGALALIVSLFLNWYDPSLSAWDVFEVVDWLLLALAAAALVVIATETSGAVTPTNRMGWIAGAALLLVAAMLIDPPPVARDAGRDVGAWIALGGAVLMAGGALLALAHISVTIDVTDRERRRRRTAVDRRDDLAGAGPGSPVASGSASAAASPGPEAPARGGSLFRESGGRASRRAEPAKPQVVPTSDVVGDPMPTPADDPERTQPLSPTDRPDDRKA
jgi:hypothetical protein